MALNALTREIGLQQEAREAAILAEQREIEMLSALAGTQADFFTSIGSAREDALQSERSFNASITDIRTSAAEAQTSARESSNEKLISLEEQRAAEEHRILTGAHARTTVENDNLLAANNTHFQQLKDAELTALGERQAAVEADFADRESKAQVARAKELAEQQAHLEELKLNAALATLESVGQLEQFTGGLTVSASEAADLIRAGVIPVTDELGAAVQSTLGGLQEKEAEAAAQAVSNQALLQQAYAGTLVPLQAQAAALGTEIPTAAAAAQQSMGLVNQDIVTGAQNAALASQEQDLALQNLGVTTFPTLGAAAQTATETINEAFTTMVTPIGETDLALSNISLVTLPLLQETFLLTTTMMIEQLLLLLETGILPVDFALIKLYTVTLPTLQQISDVTTQAMVTGFQMVIDIVNLLITTIQNLIAALQTLMDTFKELAKVVAEATKEILDEIQDMESGLGDLKEAVDKVRRAFEDMGAAAETALNRAGSSLERTGQKSGLFNRGIGFQGGTLNSKLRPVGDTLGIGVRIPQGFSGDSFGPMFAQSDEEMLITPRGMSIQGLVFSRLADLLQGSAVQGGSVTNNYNYNFQMTVNAGSSPQAVIRQYEVMRGLIG
jgi:hypothetical protein